MINDPTHLFWAWLIIAALTAFAIGWAIATHRAVLKAIDERYGPFDACFCDEHDDWQCDAFNRTP